MNEDMIQFFEIVYTALKQEFEFILFDNEHNRTTFRSDIEFMRLIYSELLKNNFKYKIAGKTQYSMNCYYCEIALKDKKDNIRAFIDFKILYNNECRDITVDINKLKSRNNATEQYFNVNKLNAETIIDKYIFLIVLGGDLEENKKYIEEQNSDIIEQVNEPRSFTGSIRFAKEVEHSKINLYMYKLK